MKKPIQLRIIFILNALLVLICFAFYGVAKSKGSVGGISPNTVLYTAISYVALFTALVTSIKKFNLIALRVTLVLVFAASIPATAIIGLVISVITFVLSFHKKIKQYFNQ